MPDANTKIEEIETPTTDAKPTEDRVGFLDADGRNHLINLINAGVKTQISGCLPMLADGYEMAKAWKYFVDGSYDPADFPKPPEGGDKLLNCDGASEKALAFITVAIRIAVAGQAPKDHTSAYTIAEVMPVVEAIRYFTVPTKA